MKWLALLPRPTRGYPHHEVSRHALHLTPQQRFQLRRLLRTTDDLGAYRRTLALLQLDRGDTVTDVAAILGVSRRTVHR